MPTVLRMPDELYEADLRNVVCPHYAYHILRNALRGYPSPQPAFYPHLLDFLARNYHAPEHLLDEAFQALQADLERARVLITDEWPMISAYLWQPPNGEREGRWIVPGWVFAEHRAMLQLALENVKRDVPSAGIHEEQDSPAPKVPYRKKTTQPPHTSLQPGHDLVDQMTQHSSGEARLSPDASITLRKDLGKMNQQLNPGEQFMVPDYSADELAYLEEKNQKFSNDVAMVLSPPSATFGLPTRWATEDESRVAGAVNAGMAVEGVAAFSAISGKPQALSTTGHANAPKGARGPATQWNGFDEALAGGPVRSFNTSRIRITEKGVSVVEKHTDRFGYDEANAIMIERLRRIERGELAPTQQDLNFYSHELREFVRYRKLGWKEGVPADSDKARQLWLQTHTATLDDYALPLQADEHLYHSDALKALYGE